MLFVIDSNEYIFAFGSSKESNALHLLDRIVKEISGHSTRIPRTIFEEVKRNLSPDAFIAAYTEWTGADILVTENRHFLSKQQDLRFKVLSAEKCLKLLIKTSS